MEKAFVLLRKVAGCQDGRCGRCAPKLFRMVSVLWKLKVLQGAIGRGSTCKIAAGRQEGMGSKRGAYAPGAMLRLLISLAGLNLCWLCLAPVATADWETVYCTTTADSLDVAAAKSAIEAYQQCVEGRDSKEVCSDLCCQSSAFGSQCSTFTTAGSTNFYMCGSLRCDECEWISDMWLKVVDSCTQNYGGVDRAAGYVAYNWSPGFYNKYGF